MSRPRFCNRSKCASSGAGVHGCFERQIMRFSLFWTAPCEPSTVADAPGDGGFKNWPFVRADTFEFKMNRRGFKTKSKGQEEPASLAFLDGDGPVSRSRRQECPTHPYVPRGNHMKQRPTPCHPIIARPPGDEQRSSQKADKSMVPEPFRGISRAPWSAAHRRPISCRHSGQAVPNETI